MKRSEDKKGKAQTQHLFGQYAFLVREGVSSCKRLKVSMGCHQTHPNSLSKIITKGDEKDALHTGSLLSVRTQEYRQHHQRLRCTAADHHHKKSCYLAPDFPGIFSLLVCVVALSYQPFKAFDAAMMSIDEFGGK